MRKCTVTGLHIKDQEGNEHGYKQGNSVIRPKAKRRVAVEPASFFKIRELDQTLADGTATLTKTVMSSGLPPT